METPTNPIYLNTAACGLLSESSLKNTMDFYAALTTNASTRAEQWRQNEQQRIRQVVASFIHAPVANIVFLPNFSFGINTVVQSLKGNEKVLLYKSDYPSLLDPFRINNFDITWIDAKDGFTIDIDELKQTLLDKKIDILAISHVQWQSGFRFYLPALGAFCKEHNVTLIVDATQSLGAVAIDIELTQPDVLIASNYKWMNAGFGTGIMYMSDAFFDKYPPVVGGFASYTMVDGKMTYIPSVRNYEPGHTNIHGLLVMEAAILEKQAIGMDNIEAHNGRLTQLVLDQLAELPVKLLGGTTMENRCSIVLIGDENGLGSYLSEKNIVVTKRGGMIRVSMHYYNTVEEVMYFTEALRAFYRKG